MGGTESEKAAVRGQVRGSSWTRIKEEGDRLLLCGRHAGGARAAAPSTHRACLSWDSSPSVVSSLSTGQHHQHHDRNGG